MWRTQKPVPSCQVLGEMTPSCSVWAETRIGTQHRARSINVHNSRNIFCQMLVLFHGRNAWSVQWTSEKSGTVWQGTCPPPDVCVNISDRKIILLLLYLILWLWKPHKAQGIAVFQVTMLSSLMDFSLRSHCWLAFYSSYRCSWVALSCFSPIQLEIK